MNVTSRWMGILAVGLAAACAACGDDESAEGSGGGGGGDVTSTTSGTPSGSTSATTSGTSTTTTTTSTGGPEACPETQPVEGEACALTDPATCHYDQEAVCPDGAFTNASIDATCTGGAWVLDVVSSGECCPEYVTQSGAIPCSIATSVCEYPGDVLCDGGGFIAGSVIATCDGESWQTVYEPTGGVCEGESECPAEPPLNNSACDFAFNSITCMWEDASPCPDGQGFNVITVAKCNAGFGTWAVGTLFEGTQCPACDEDPLACPIDGLACVQTNGCEDAEGSVDTGTICIDGAPNAVWDVFACE